jgi:hypothetical protein
MAFSPDCKILAVAVEANDHGNFGGGLGGGGFGGGFGGAGLGGAPGIVSKKPRISLRDLATAQEISNLSFEKCTIESLAFSPDGKTLASSPVRFWDLPTGQVLPLVSTQKQEAIDLVFSRDGKTLASWESGVVRLWEVATRQMAWEFQAPKDRSFASVYFTSGGRVLALSHRRHYRDTSQEDIVRVWDVWQRKELYSAPQSNYPRCAALSSDGTILATDSGDTSILLWKVPLQDNSSSKVLKPPDLERLWADLAGEDVPVAYQAIRALVASPEQSVPFLKIHFQPAPKTRISQLIADLDDDRFNIREAASRELALLGEDAEPALRQAAASDSLEVRQRAQRLLQHLGSRAKAKQLSPDERRLIRTAQVLEQIGNKDAIELLQELVRGAPEAQLTQEAKASLERLKPRLQRDGN